MNLREIHFGIYKVFNLFLDFEEDEEIPEEVVEMSFARYEKRRKMKLQAMKDYDLLKNKWNKEDNYDNGKTKPKIPKYSP